MMMMMGASAAALRLLVLLLAAQVAAGFFALPRRLAVRTRRAPLAMIFDFLRQRTEEGLAQVQNLAAKTLEGKLAEALADSAEYIRTRSKIDAENFRKLIDGLAASRLRLLSGISAAFASADSNVEEQLAKLEEALLQADLGSSTASTIIDDLRNYARSEQLSVEDIAPVMRERLIEALTMVTTPSGFDARISQRNLPAVMFVIGANGMGKTTTIGKMAARFRQEGNLTVLLGACDTFRAAAVEQLQQWAIRANVSIEVPTERGGDPVPVVRRALQRAIAEQYDVLIIDTSGRLANNFELTEQLQEMKKSMNEILPGAPHEIVLVVDGSVGRNAVDQALTWRKYVGVDSLVVTKLDGTARGGFVVPVVKDLRLPIKFIGVGEKIDDLRDFKPEIFVDALLGNKEEDIAAMKAKANKILQTSPQRTEKVAKALAANTGPASRLKAALDQDAPAEKKVVAGVNKRKAGRKRR